MKSITLPFANELKTRLKSEELLIQVILGPRQVGKTTTILNLFENEFNEKDYQYESSESHQANQTWLDQIWSATREGKILIIDEIQKVPDWSEAIKKLWDENKRKKISTRLILLGSSSLDIQKGLSESLTGRFELLRAWHWTLEESEKGYSIDFENFLRWGGYPGSYKFLKQPSRWLNYINDSIIDTVLNKDILAHAKVKSPSLFRQAFYLMCSYPSQEISFNKLLGQLQDKGNIDVIKYYLSLFEGAYLLKGIYKFSTRPITTKQSSPKIIVMAQALSNASPQTLRDSEFQGRVFESLVGATLLRAGFELTYWRDGNSEVDFVINDRTRLLAIEVKSGRPKKTKGLIEFKKKFPRAKILILTKENFRSFSKDPDAFIEKHSL